MNPYKQFITTTNGMKFFYQGWGDRGREVILLHGLASHSGIWDLSAPILAKHNKVIALDQRGHGKSDKPNNGYDFNTVARDVHLIWESLGYVNPILVGHSWGGNVALHCATNYPDQVAGLVLVDGGFIEPSSRLDWTWERAQSEMAPPNFNNVTAAHMRRRIKTGNLAACWTPDIEHIILSNFYTTPEGLIKPHLHRDNHMRIVRALWDHKPSKLYNKIQCPTLILPAGDTSARKPVDESRQSSVSKAEASIPNVKVIWMRDTQHDIPLQRPTDLANSISDFISDLP